MKKKSYKTLRKFLYGTLFVLVGLTLGIAVTGIIKDRIEYTSTWQYHATYDFEQTTKTGENGEEITVFSVSTPEQLAGAFNLIEKTEGAKTVKAEVVKIDDKDALINNLSKSGVEIRLTDNINLGGKNWTPVYFSSTSKLEGEGYRISNIKLNKTSSTNIGFLSSNYGTVNNVVFDTITISNPTSNTYYAGIVAGYNYGTGIITNVIISKGCSITGTSATDSTNYCGGVAGYNSGTIDCCWTEANVAEGKYVGGVVGYNSGTISNCYNGGVIKAISSVRSTGYVGGIAGYTSTNIKLSQNHGQVTSKAAKTNYAGGIAGYAGALISECFNNKDATIVSGTANSTKSFAGGIVGYSNSNGVQFSYNRASVSAYAAESKGPNTDSKTYGSIQYDYVVDRFTDDEFYILIYNQWRKHTYTLSFTSKGHKATGLETGRKSYIYQAYAGGIIGAARTQTCKVESCYNLGSIEGGRKEFEDMYAYVLQYDQYHNQITVPLGYTKYGRRSIRVYYNMIRYTYENYAQPMIGYIDNGLTSSNISNSLNYNIGSEDYTKDETFNCASYGFNYYREGFNPISAFGTIGLLAVAPAAVALGAVGCMSAITIVDLFKSNELKSSPKNETYKSNRYVANSTNYKLSGDGDPFNIYASKNKVKDVTQEFKVDASNGGTATVKATFKVNGSKKVANLSNFRVDNTDDPVRLNQYSPSTGDYKKLSSSSLKSSTATSTLNNVKKSGKSVW
ncbi:MAG: hypothetical protein J6Q51_03420, partial [Clostridia bacterium]|nr:hypothetical protein [Clostridia bacterium]